MKETEDLDNLLQNAGEHFESGIPKRAHRASLAENGVRNFSAFHLEMATNLRLVLGSLWYLITI